MMKLKRATIHKYKCIENSQSFDVEDDITVLVGMNESGKTSILEAIAKANYFTDDKSFQFNSSHDYPRKEKKKMVKSGATPQAVTLELELGNELLSEIAEDLGEGVFTSQTISRTIDYNNKGRWSGLNTDRNIFIKNQTKVRGISSVALNEKLQGVESLEDLERVKSGYKDEALRNGIADLERFYQNKWCWANDPLGEYVARKYLRPNLPKFLYYDEFYSLPSRISIEGLQKETLEDEELKTAKALFELAEINISDLVNSDDFEDFTAELEATEATISEELFNFWSTNTNLEISFKIDKRDAMDEHGNRRIVEHILDIRVRNNRAKVTLPLRNRSKGFNWFFSFLVWFKKIQEDKNSNYVLLLDEPGLNLHASAQADLLRFIEHLSGEYQILYTTHSPFMVDPSQLHKVRTVVETREGAVVSDSIDERDPKTLFPLQAALGYDLAQNLFISKHNLLVEGVSDLVYLQIMSGILQAAERESLDGSITIVPVGGMEKVSTFVSLLRGSQLDIACLLDSSIDTRSKAKLDNVVREKLIEQKKVVFFDEFVSDAKEADIEDMFSKEEYLYLFNSAFTELADVTISDLNPKINRIVLQLNKHLKKERYNHFRPANFLAQSGASATGFSEDTLSRFEQMFVRINSLFGR